MKPFLLFVFWLLNIKKRTSRTPFHPDIWGFLPFLIFPLILTIPWYYQMVQPEKLSFFQANYLLEIGPLFFYYVFGLMIMLFITIISFPHVPNLKISFLGYLFMISGMLYAFRLANAPYFKDFGHITPMYFLVMFNLLLISIVPGFLRRETNRLVCAIATSMELGLVMLLLEKGSVIFNFTLLHGVWIFPLCTAIIITSWFFSRNNYGLGGGISGLACYYTFGHIFRNTAIENIIWLSTPLLLSIIILYNWLTRLSYRVSYDPVLNIYTRGFCNNIIHGHANINMGSKFSVAMLDIDHFKRINDTYGHEMGDRVLHNIAQVVRGYAMPRGITCRYGGEELAIFFPHTKLYKAVAISERIHKAVGKVTIPVAKNKKETLTISIGVATNYKGESILQTLKRADDALYRAKEGGRNQVKKAEPPLTEPEQIQPIDNQSNTSPNSLA
ncbi:diguanylate cyclase [bacterium]|nr:diguanylate cyclase [bacterium]